MVPRGESPQSHRQTPAGGSWRGGSHQSRPQKLMRLLRTFAADPADVIRALPGEFRQRYGREQYRPVEVDEAWDEHLHRLLSAPWPCSRSQEVDAILTEIGARLA